MTQCLRLRAFVLGCACVAATAGATESTSVAPKGEKVAAVVAKVEHAIERGAKAAASGIERGAKAAEHGVKVGVEAAARGLETGAKAVARVADSAAEKVRP